MNVNSFNYDSLANLDDSRYDVVNGRKDTLAFNYNDYDYDGYPNSVTGINGIDVNTAIDDYFYGCMQPTAELWFLANITRQVSIVLKQCHDPCFYIKFQVADDFKCNYSNTAEVDDGSCLHDDTCGECGGLAPINHERWFVQMI